MTVTAPPRIRRVAVLRAAGESSARDTAAFRALDIAVAGPLFLALAPVLAIIAAAIRIESPGPPVERQRRLGMDLEPFALLVFRTRHRGRPTRVGRLLEQHGLHWLPSLLNVIRGEMSIVGPPPVLPAEVAHYPPHWFERFAVKPGLVCLTPGSVGEEAGGCYLEYVRRRSLRLNLRICSRRLMQAREMLTVRHEAAGVAEPLSGRQRRHETDAAQVARAQLRSNGHDPASDGDDRVAVLAARTKTAENARDRNLS